MPYLNRVTRADLQDLSTSLWLRWSAVAAPGSDQSLSTITRARVAYEHSARATYAHGRLLSVLHTLASPAVR